MEWSPNHGDRQRRRVTDTLRPRSLPAVLASFTFDSFAYLHMYWQRPQNSSHAIARCEKTATQRARKITRTAQCDAIITAYRYSIEGF